MIVRSRPCNHHYKMALISGVLTGKQVVCACAGVFFHSLCPACPVASSGLIVSNQSGWKTSPTALVVYLRTEFPVFWASSPRSWSSFSRDALKLCCRRIRVCPVCVFLPARFRDTGTHDISKYSVLFMYFIDLIFLSCQIFLLAFNRYMNDLFQCPSLRSIDWQWEKGKYWFPRNNKH